MKVPRIIVAAVLLTGVSIVLGACAPILPRLVPSTPAPAPKSAVFITSNLTIEPEAISIGDSSTIGVMVTNTGEQMGTYPVVLKVNDTIAETQNATLASGASQMVTFIFNPSSTRDYMIAIDQLKGVLKVSCEVPET